MDLGGCMEAGGLVPHQPSQGPPGIGTGSGPGNNNNNNNTICSVGGGGVGVNNINNNNIGLSIQQHQQQQLQINRVRSVTNHSPINQGFEHLNSTLQLNQQQQQQLQQLQQQMGQAPGMGETIAPKKQGADRLKRRMDNYRRHQNDCVPKFSHGFQGHCEQNSQETYILQKRFLESKAKRQPKKTDKKQNDNVGLSSVHVVSLIYY